MLLVAASVFGLMPFERESVSVDAMNALRNLESLPVVGDEGLGCRSFMHAFCHGGGFQGLVPRRFFWCSGPNPCTTEDHPLPRALHGFMLLLLVIWPDRRHHRT